MFCKGSDITLELTGCEHKAFNSIEAKIDERLAVEQSGRMTCCAPSLLEIVFDVLINSEK